MFDLFKRYVDEGYMRFDKGDIWFGKERIIFYFIPYTARELYLNTKISGWRYLAAKFVSSRKEGYTIMQQHGAPNMEEITAQLNACMKIMGILGLGTFRIVKADSDAGFAVVSGVSTLALETRDESLGSYPMDFVIGGLLAGVVQYHSKRQAYAIETSCVSMKGTKECTWVIGGRQDIAEYIQKSAPDRLDYANKTLDQTEAFEKEMQQNEKMRGIV